MLAGLGQPVLADVAAREVKCCSVAPSGTGLIDDALTACRSFGAPRRVVNIIVGDGDKELVDVGVDGEVITATGGHPFWVDDTGEWIDADDLVAGDELLGVDGAYAAVESVEHYSAVRRVHNLTIDGIHTYYVVANDVSVLVHNCGKFSNGLAPRTTAWVDDATAEVGRRGAHVDVVPGTNPRATIGGREYSGHALDRMQGQGITPAVVDNALITSTGVSGKVSGTTAYYDAVNDLTVITDTASGRVVTVDYGRIRQ